MHALRYLLSAILILSFSYTTPVYAAEEDLKPIEKVLLSFATTPEQHAALARYFQERTSEINERIKRDREKTSTNNKFNLHRENYTKSLIEKEQRLANLYAQAATQQEVLAQRR